MKHIFTLFLILLIVPLTFAEKVKIDGLYYNLDSDTNTAEVTYYSFSSSSNSSYVKGDLEIPNQVSYEDKVYSVTSIGNYAFDGCSSLTSVEIPNSVTSIGGYAFSDCTGLTSIEIPNSVTSIGDHTFEKCSRIKEVIIEDGENYLSVGCNSSSSGLFSYCPLKKVYLGRTLNYEYSPFRYKQSIQSVIVGDSVTQIGNSLFSGCTSLSEINISNSVTSIGEEAFRNCSGLTSVEIGNSVTSIGAWAFRDCSGLTSVEIGNSVTSIGAWAFYYCKSLTSIEIPNSVTSIGNHAFYNCSGLKSVIIGNSVTSIGEEAFAGCSGLTNVEIPNSVTSIGNYAFSDCTGLISVEIPNSVTSIGWSAFQDCSSLTSVIIPNSVTSIGNSAFYGCGLTEIILESETPPSYYPAFSVYTKKAALTIPDTADIPAYLVSDWRNFLNIEQDNGGKIFLENDGVFEYRFIESLGQAYLVPSSGYSNLTSASIPDRVVADRYGSESFYQVTGISPNAFKNCFTLTQVKLPANCEVIGSSAFESCRGLTSIEIPNSVTSIGNYAFDGCSSLTSVEIPNSVTSIGGYAFVDCWSLTRVDIIDFEAWCNIDFEDATANPLYYAKNLWLNSEFVTSLSIPASISEIKNYTFYNCQSLTGDLQIPSNITSIGASAFEKCTGILSVNIPSSVNSIGAYAFDNIKFNNFIIEDGFETLEWTGENSINVQTLYIGRTIQGPIKFTGLNSIKVSSFVESIPTNCCKNNTSLESVVINPGGGIVIEEGSFQGCNKLSDVILPADIAEIAANAFSGTAIKNISVPNGTIGANAFANCNLDNIILGAGVESIGEKAFDGSNAINAVYATPTTPPAAENNTFSYYEAQLYVPEESIDTYYNFTRCWYRFSGKPLVMPDNIEVTGPTTISGEEGETFQLTATITPSNVTLDRVLWHSTNPAIASVDNNGLVTIHNFTTDGSKAKAANTVSCQIIATTLYADSPVAMVTIETGDENAVEYINSDNIGGSGQQGTAPNDIFTLQGVCLKRNASQSDIDALAPGIYIIAGKKVIVK